MISKSTFYQILFILTCFHCSWSQTLFQENMGSPTSTTNITSNVFENTTSLSYSNGEQSNSADVRITNASTGYSGASSGGNIFFSSTAGAYGFSIEGINASSYTSLSLQFGYRKESSTSHALFSVDYWNGSAWVVNGLGQEVVKPFDCVDDELSVDLSGLSAGVYFIKMAGVDGGVVVKRVLKR